MLPAMQCVHEACRRTAASRCVLGRRGNHCNGDAPCSTENHGRRHAPRGTAKASLAKRRRQGILAAVESVVVTNLCSSWRLHSIFVASELTVRQFSMAILDQALTPGTHSAVFRAMPQPVLDELVNAVPEEATTEQIAEEVQYASCVFLRTRALRLLFSRKGRANCR